MSDLPDDKDCQKVVEDGETLYLCDGVLYRSTYYEDERVYEIVSDAPDAPEPETVFGLSLTEPMTRGAVVRDLQGKLSEAGYDVGAVDGVFGSSTETALMWYQYDNGLDATGIVDADTAALMGFESPVGTAPATPPAAAPAEEPAAETPAEPTPVPSLEEAPEAETSDEAEQPAQD